MGGKREKGKGKFKTCIRKIRIFHYGWLKMKFRKLRREI